jgi:hypothetical protein
LKCVKSDIIEPTAGQHEKCCVLQMQTVLRSGPSLIDLSDVEGSDLKGCERDMPEATAGEHGKVGVLRT